MLDEAFKQKCREELDKLKAEKLANKVSINDLNIETKRQVRALETKNEKISHEILTLCSVLKMKPLPEADEAVELKEKRKKREGKRERKEREAREAAEGKIVAPELQEEIAV